MAIKEDEYHDLKLRSRDYLLSVHQREVASSWLFKYTKQTFQMVSHGESLEREIQS